MSLYTRFLLWLAPKVPQWFLTRNQQFRVMLAIQETAVVRLSKMLSVLAQANEEVGSTINVNDGVFTTFFDKAFQDLLISPTHYGLTTFLKEHSKCLEDSLIKKEELVKILNIEVFAQAAKYVQARAIEQNAATARRDYAERMEAAYRTEIQVLNFFKDAK